MLRKIIVSIVTLLCIPLLASQQTHYTPTIGVEIKKGAFMGASGLWIEVTKQAQGKTLFIKRFHDNDGKEIRILYGQTAKEKYEINKAHYSQLHDYADQARFIFEDRWAHFGKQVNEGEYIFKLGSRYKASLVVNKPIE